MAVSSIASGTTARTQTTTPTPAEAKQTWTKLLDQGLGELNGLKGQAGFLGEGRINLVKDNVTKDMEAWVKAHPDATLEDIQKEASRSFKSHQTHQICNKFADDWFFGRLMRRYQELSQDMWS